MHPSCMLAPNPFLKRMPPCNISHQMQLAAITRCNVTSYASASNVISAACIYEGMNVVLAFLVGARCAWHSCSAHDAHWCLHAHGTWARSPVRLGNVLLLGPSILCVIASVPGHSK